MFLRELFEQGNKHITFCFGRMNPPTIGHEQVFDAMKSQGGEMRIFVSQSQDAKKNPLDYGTKIKFIKAMFPEYASSVVDNSGLNTIVKVASHLFDQGYTTATFVAGSDRLEDMKKLLEAYNGVEGKAHGYYKFEMLDFVSSGEREDGAEGVAGVSASGARLAAANNDFEGFKEATGAGELAKPLYAAVRKGMNIGESKLRKTKEFISELTVGKYATGGTVPTKDPIGRAAFRKNSKIAYDIVKSVNDAPTSKDKIEILANLDAGKTTNKIVIVGPKDKRYAFKSYDRAAGTLTVSLATTLYTVDVDSLEFLGKERIISNTSKKWLFKTNNLEVQGKMEPKPGAAKPGRPAKSTYTMPDRLWSL